MIFSAIICYILAALLPVAALLLAVRILKKYGKKVYISHSFIGALFFILMLVGMFALMLYAFSKDVVATVTAFVPEGIYKITLALVFFTVIGLIRYFALNKCYFGNFKEEKGISFLFGYGICGGVAISAYCVFMALHILFTSIATPFVSISEQAVLLFENGARISVFTPFYSHIAMSVVFVIYFALMIVIALFMAMHSAHPYKWQATFRMYLLTHLSELLAVVTLLFASSSVNPVVIAVICVVMLVLSALSVKFLYKYQEELPYDKQFE